MPRAPAQHKSHRSSPRNRHPEALDRIGEREQLRVARLDIQKVIAFHRAHGRLATVTAVHPPSRFGTLDIASDDKVSAGSVKNLGQAACLSRADWPG